MKLRLLCEVRRTDWGGILNEPGEEKGGRGDDRQRGEDKCKEQMK